MAKQIKRFIKVRSTDCPQVISLEVIGETNTRIIINQMVAIHIVGSTVVQRTKKEVHWSKTTGKIVPAIKGKSTIYRIVDGLEVK